MTSADSTEETRKRVTQTLEEELEHVTSPVEAEEVVSDLERLAGGTTEAEQAEAATREKEPAASKIEHAQADAERRARPAALQAAEVLAETAREAAVPTAEGEAVVEGARDVLAPQPDAALLSSAQRGSELLKEAVLRHLGPLHALDTRIFLAINRVPHPAWTDRLAKLITVWTTGGWVWAGAVLLARSTGTPRATRALVLLLPSMIGATTIVEYPVKWVFRRQRPFIDVVRALVVGKQPGSWSFPSGHTASSFACAWVLSTVWPRKALLFFSLASIVGFSRIYVGAHYPGDVMSGAFFGMTISELTRMATSALLRRRRYHWA